MGKIRTWLLHADLIGKPFGLKINGRDTHQTIGGAIFSLIGILSVLTYATYLFVIITLQGDIMNINLQIKNGIHRTSEEFNLHSLNQLPTIEIIPNALTDPDTFNVEDFFTIFVRMIKTTTDKNNAKIDTILGTYDYALCPNSRFTMCPPEAAIKSLNASFNSVDSKITFRLSVYPCSTGFTCVSKSFVKGTQLLLYFNQAEIDLDDKSNTAIRKPPLVRQKLIDPYTSEVEYRTLNLVEVQDKRGFPYNDKTVDRMMTSDGYYYITTFRLDERVMCARSDFEDASCSPFAEFNAEMTNTYTIYERHYRSLLGTFAEVGGFYSSVLLVLGIIYTLVDSGGSTAYIVKQVFGIIRKKQSFKYYLLCCQKKYRDQGTPKSTEDKSAYTYVSTDVYNAAVDNIAKGLDAVSLSKDITCLKFLLFYLFNEYHMKLVPLALLDKAIDNQNNAKAADKPSATENPGSFPELTLKKSSLSMPSLMMEEDQDLNDKFRGEGLTRRRVREAMGTLDEMKGKSRQGGFKDMLHADLDSMLSTIFSQSTLIPLLVNPRSPNSPTKQPSIIKSEKPISGVVKKTYESDKLVNIENVEGRLEVKGGMEVGEVAVVDLEQTPPPPLHTDQPAHDLPQPTLSQNPPKTHHKHPKPASKDTIFMDNSPISSGRGHNHKYIDLCNGDVSPPPKY
jgi:hypothetical protein